MLTARRAFLRSSALTLGGLTLGSLTEGSEKPSRPKSLIMIHLSGGPSHLDMYDMKPAAPLEYRGEFRPTSTCVPGMQICELMPRQAKIADKFTVLRGVKLTHLHSANEFYSGYPWQETPRAVVPGNAQRPAIGSVVSQLRGAGSVPPYVSMDNQNHWERAYYLGQEHEPFRVGGNSSRESYDNMKRHNELSAERMQGRTSLLKAVDSLQRRLERNVSLDSLTALQDRALRMVLSGKLRDAFDVSKEPQKVRDRYGHKPFKVLRQDCIKSYHDQGHPGPKLLQARRLVEAGVSVVTYAMGGFDTHRYNFDSLRAMLPPLDQAVTALVQDLDERGMLDDVVIMMGGEFGRTPRIGDVTPDGRSHWPAAGFLWFAGGGIRTGQMIGATDARGEEVLSEPIQMQNVMTSLYQVLGIDPGMTFRDYNGRPQYLVEDRRPVKGLT